MKTTIILFIFGVVLLCLALPVLPVFADGMVSPFQLEIQGAKIVSEGAYFRFTLRNTDLLTKSFLVEYNSSFTVFLQTNPILLQPNETININVIAPFLAKGQVGAKYPFKFTKVTTNQSVTFYVYVVDFETTESILSQHKRWTFDELWEQYVKVFNENSKLKDAIRNAGEEANEKLKQAQSLIYINLFILGFAFLAGITVGWQITKRAQRQRKA